MDLLEAKDATLSYLKTSNAEIMKWYRTKVTVETKSDQSPVTIADRKVEEILRKKISKDHPNHSIIGEEFGEDISDSEWAWTIDPIDGTYSFIRGLPLFASLIALLHKGKPVMGIISLPAVGETAWAIKGKGAYCGGQRLLVSKHNKVKGSFIGIADLHCFKEKKSLNLFNRLKREAKIVRTYPDAFGHLMAIRGVIDVMVDPWANIWDFAPCKIMTEEAGGKFANFTGNKSGIDVGNAVSGNPGLVKEVRRMIQEENPRKQV